MDIHAAALNFRDILLSMHALPQKSFEGSYYGFHMGMEASGVVRAVGSEVRHIKVGSKVAVSEPGCFASRIVASAARVFPLPDEADLEQTACIQSVYLTAHYALVTLARVKQGDRVLIHAAAGGVGHAAISICQFIGAEIFATASLDKHSYVESLGIPKSRIFNSRTCEWYNQIVDATNGNGVDVVLNCLTGEHQTLGLQILRAGGRFCEIGKMDIYTNQCLPLLPFRKNISFFAIDVDRMQLENPELLMTICQEVFHRIADGSYKYIPYKKFSMDKIHEAITLMKTGKHIGKVLLTNRNEDGSAVSVKADKKLSFDPNRPILVVGGAGGFGSQVIEWAYRLGARRFMVTTRPQDEGKATQKIESMFRHLVESGCTIDTIEVDLSDSKDQEKLGAICLESNPSIQGIVLSVGIWETKGVYEMQNGDLESACDLKVASAWHLHQVSMKMNDLHHFIMVGSFSSKILILHNMSVYGASNSILDRKSVV